MKGSSDLNRRRYIGVSGIIAAFSLVIIAVAIVFVIAAGVHGRPIIGKPACEYPQQTEGESKRIYEKCIQEQQRRFLGEDVQLWRLAP